MMFTEHEQKICLNMIVKNEAHVIERCLLSVKPFISSWAILDTGSTDNTPELVRRALAGVPGALGMGAWEGFATSRNRALDLALQSGSDYILFLDADAIFHAGAFWNPDLDSDALLVEHRFGPFVYYKPSIVRASLPWRWKSPIHEYLHLEGDFSRRKLEGCYIQEQHEGARSKDPDTHAKDAALLESMDQDDPRVVFYLAQSYADSQQWDKALMTYLRRSEMGGWAEERYFASLQVARILQAKEAPAEIVIRAYLLAYESRPTRSEPLGYLADYLAPSMPHVGRLLADAAKSKPLPSDLMYLEPKFYKENK